MERVCKDEWLRISKLEYGKDKMIKHESMSVFINSCPACQVCDTNCHICPVVRWRYKYHCVGARGLYLQWYNETEKIKHAPFPMSSLDMFEKAKQIAGKIARLKWTWQKCYEETELSEMVTTFLKEYEVNK
jgi:hypothetical protein